MGKKAGIMTSKFVILPFIVVSCLFTIFLSSCGRHSDRFHFEAQFKNLNQGEFYLYNPETGTKDTIAVNDGRFVYERQQKDTATLVILFPNYSEMPVFATPGASVKMTGDVSHLRETEITGTKENDLMTAFRIKTNEMMPPEVQQEARQFITEHPASIVSNYLLQHYFLQALEPDYALCGELCAMLHKAQPSNQYMARLDKQLESLAHYVGEGQLPSFTTVDTKGDTITNRQLTGDANVIVAWASWSYDSQTPMRQLRALKEDYGSRLRVISICLDASPSEGRAFLERDSIEWPNVCDSLLWQSPLLSQLSIATLPANIVVDKRGNIVGRDLSHNDLKDKVESLLK